MRNQKLRKERIFKKENKVYLQTRNLNIKNKIKKLKHIAEDLFKVIKNIQNAAYELNILNFKIHNVFNASLLIKTDKRVFLTKTFEIKARKKNTKLKKF